MQSLQRTDLAKSLFVLVSLFFLPLSFIPRKHWTLLVKYYNTVHAAQCARLHVQLCSHVSATQCSISTSVGQLQFLPPYKKPLCPLVVTSCFLLCWQPQVHFLSPRKCLFWISYMDEKWMKNVFWLFSFTKMMFLRFSLHCIIRSTTFFCHGLRKFCWIKYGPFQCPLRSRQALGHFWFGPFRTFRHLFCRDTGWLLSSTRLEWDRWVTWKQQSHARVSASSSTLGNVCPLV